MSKRKALAAGTLAAAALFGASKQAEASAVLIPSIKSGGGWVSVISYINTASSNVPGDVPGVHITYQYKSSLAPAMTTCNERNLLVPTSRNDLTTYIVDATVSPIPKPPIFEGGLIGTVGGGYDPGIPMQGFVVLENVIDMEPPTVETCQEGTSNCQTLAAEAIVFNLSSRFIYSQRALEMHHAGFSNVNELMVAAPRNHNTIVATMRADNNDPVDHAYAPGSTPNVGYFAFLPTDIADTVVYAIAVNRPRGTLNPSGAANDVGATTNFVGVNYGAAARLTAITEDPIQGYYLRDEQRLSAVRTVDFRCVAEIPAASPDGQPGLVPTDPVIRRHGAWFNLRPLAMCADNTGAIVPCTAPGIAAEAGDGVIAFKVELNPSYGFVITPLHQLFYIR